MVSAQKKSPGRICPGCLAVFPPAAKAHFLLLQSLEGLRTFQSPGISVFSRTFFHEGGFGAMQKERTIFRTIALCIFLVAACGWPGPPGWRVNAPAPRRVLLSLWR
jgi:hypothetical protein